VVSIDLILQAGLPIFAEEHGTIDFLGSMFAGFHCESQSEKVKPND
jgi:hypothetical protein